MENSKYHVGFPVDGGLSRYYLLYPSYSTNCFVCAQKKEKVDINPRLEPEGLTCVKQLLKTGYFMFYRKGTEKKPCGGTSSSLAFLIAGLLSAKNFPEMGDLEAPVMLFSCSIAVPLKKIEDIRLNSVTGKDKKKAIESLKNKWRSVLELKDEKRKVILFLHNEDIDALNSTGFSIPEPKTLGSFIDPDKQEASFWKQIDLSTKDPELFLLKDNDFSSLAVSLGVDLLEKEDLPELFAQVAEETKERGVKIETVKKIEQILSKLNDREKLNYFDGIARFHLEAAKTYSHVGDYENIKKHLAMLEALLYMSESEIRNKRASLFLESAVIDANAKADLKMKLDEAYYNLDESLKDETIPKDINYWKALSAKGHIGRLAKKYEEARKDLEKVVSHIDQHEVLQPRIQLISVLARSKKIKAAVEKYKETEVIISKNQECRDKDKSLEFLRLAGCEIVLGEKPEKRKEVYCDLNELPQAFSNEGQPKCFHNQLFLHYKFLIERSLGNDNISQQERSEFYEFIAQSVASSVVENKVTLVSLIQLAILMAYIYSFELKKSEYHERLIAKFVCSFPSKPQLPAHNEIYRIGREMYNKLKSGKVPGRKRLLGYIDETMYMIAKI